MKSQKNGNNKYGTIKLKSQKNLGGKSMLKNEKGITLIALVVMIVVTTILAGITINASIGNRGLIKEARDTQSNIEQAKQEGLQQIEDLKNQETTIEDGVQSQTDVTAPKINSITFTKLGTNTVTVNVDVVEEESGIAKIEYTAKEGTNVTTSGEIKEKSYRFNNLKTQTKYEVTVTVTDNADNTSSLTREVTIL